jgi:hypothetical protein
METVAHVHDVSVVDTRSGKKYTTFRRAIDERAAEFEGDDINEAPATDLETSEGS